VLLGRIAIGDWFTAAIGLIALVVLFRWKVNNPLLMAVTAAAGSINYFPKELSETLQGNTLYIHHERCLAIVRTHAQRFGTDAEEKPVRR